MKPRHQRLEIRLHTADMERLKGEARTASYHDGDRWLVGMTLSDYVRKLLGCPPRKS